MSNATLPKDIMMILGFRSTMHIIIRISRPMVMISLNITLKKKMKRTSGMNLSHCYPGSYRCFSPSRTVMKEDEGQVGK